MPKLLGVDPYKVHIERLLHRAMVDLDSRQQLGGALRDFVFICVLVVYRIWADLAAWEYSYMVWQWLAYNSMHSQNRTTSVNNISSKRIRTHIVYSFAVSVKALPRQDLRNLVTTEATWFVMETLGVVFCRFAYWQLADLGTVIWIKQVERMMVEQMKGRLLERKYKLLHHHVSAVAKAAEINRKGQHSISTNGNSLHQPEPPKILFVRKKTPRMLYFMSSYSDLPHAIPF